MNHEQINEDGKAFNGNMKVVYLALSLMIVFFGYAAAALGHKLYEFVSPYIF